MSCANQFFEVVNKKNKCTSDFWSIVSLEQQTCIFLISEIERGALLLLQHNNASLSAYHPINLAGSLGIQCRQLWARCRPKFDATRHEYLIVYSETCHFLSSHRQTNCDTYFIFLSVAHAIVAKWSCSCCCLLRSWLRHRFVRPGQNLFG